MRTDRAWKRFYATGWLVSGLFTVAAFAAWRRHLREVEQRAAELERTQEEVARRRTAEERLRIARELHDSLTHSISVVKMQAGVAIHLARKRGQEIPETLVAIQQAAGDASRELREALTVLRRDDAPIGRSLADLPDLVNRARAAGLPTTVTVTGSRRELPSEVDAAAYRIVQESLTNAARHAGPATASVVLDYRPDQLAITVADDGRGGEKDPPTPGLGLIGMRERATALGGRLTTHAGTGGGFVVQAELPCGDRP